MIEILPTTKGRKKAKMSQDIFKHLQKAKGPERPPKTQIQLNI